MNGVSHVDSDFQARRIEYRVDNRLLPAVLLTPTSNISIFFNNNDQVISTKRLVASIRENDKNLIFQPSGTYLSWSKLKGYLEPGGNKGFSSGALAKFAGGLDVLEEFPAFPDLTMPLLGGISI